MKISDELYVLTVPMTFAGQTSDLNLTLIVDKDAGATLVDTGLPGQESLILEAISEEGFSSNDLKQILLTHHDIDHIGSLHALKEKTGAPVLALDIEVPFIDGQKPPLKMPSPETLALMPEFKAMLDQVKPTPVDQALTDGQLLPLAGGVLVIATPGHTLGHLCLYLEQTKTLIAGDALTAQNGKLAGPPPR